jgi:hypothetical protein
MYSRFAKFYKQGEIDGVSVAGTDATGTLAIVVDNGVLVQHTLYVNKQGEITGSPGIQHQEAAKAALARLELAII